MNRWVWLWLAIGVACLPAALITGGYNVWSVLGIGSLAIAGLTALYRTKEKN